MKARFLRAAALLTALLLAVMLPAAAPAEYSMPVADGDLSVTQGLDERYVNILLIGTDTRGDDLASGRSDTMMICSIDQQGGEIKLTSLARDLWVEMGDNGHMNKLNAAHTYGGPNLVMQTINRRFDMNISQYISINFYGVADIVDALGGVTIELEKGEAGTINNTADPGYGTAEIKKIPSGATSATLCGAQALAYARIRKLDNDFGRTNRQRKLLAAMFKKIKSCSMEEMLAFMTTALSYVDTNIELLDMMNLAMAILDNGISDISTLSIPSEGHYRYESGDGTSKVIADLEQCTQELHEFIYN